MIRNEAEKQKGNPGELEEEAIGNEVSKQDGEEKKEDETDELLLLQQRRE